MLRPAVPLLLLLMILAGGLLPAMPGEDGDVVTAHLALEPDLLASTGAGRIPFRKEPIDGVEMPGEASADMRISKIRMASSKGLLVAMAVDPNSPRLWVDRNMDGSLADERPLWPRPPTPGAAASVLVEILAPYEGEADPQPVGLRLTWLPQNAPEHVTCQAQVHRRGTVVLGGRLRPVAISDGSFDAAFDDKRDQIWLDLDGDGQIQTVGTGIETIPRDEPFRVGDEGWIATVPGRSGRAIEFRRSATVPPAPPPTWNVLTFAKAGQTPAAPTESFAEVKKRIDEERSQPYAQRYATINVLGRFGTEEAADLLWSLAQKDKDDAVRAAALRALSHPAHLDVVGKQVLALAKKGKGAIGAAALQSLYGMGHPDRRKLYLAALEDSDTSVVATAARYLAYEPDDTLPQLFAKAIDKASSPALAYQVYGNGIRNVRTPPAVADLMRWSEIPYPLLQGQIVEDLGKLQAPEALAVARRLAERPVASKIVSDALVRTLGRSSDASSVEALIELFQHGGTTPAVTSQVRTTVLEELRRLRGPAAKQALLAALEAKLADARLASASVLGSFLDPDVTDALLVRAKKEKDEATLAAVLAALGDHGDGRAVPLLLARAKSRKSDEVRGSAVRALGRLGYHVDDVRPFLVKLLDAKDDQDRIVALDAAAVAKDDSLFDAILPSLAHDAWAVRLAAIDALAAPRVVAAIEPLIARLEVEETPRVRDALATALFDLTGQPFYDDATVWRRWWEGAKDGFEVPAERPQPPDEHVGGTQAGFFGLPIKSERVVFVVDQSGSMSAEMGEPGEDGKRKNRLDMAITEVLQAAARMAPRGHVNVILFDTTIRPWKDDLQRLDSRNANALKSHLEKQRPMGGTNIYDALEAALRTPEVDSVFLLSDGVPGAGKYVTTPDILKAVRRENQTRRIAIHTVSLGMESDLLRRLAQENAGRYVRR
ncbi:MAG: HEAT repeat domain-containing protein [Planctomycetes bacterium]|nr:HEAT repeat domain-containing protein [Planctomycetota bacterium]